jgi:toxin secretion/phage lysis holin
VLVAVRLDLAMGTAILKDAVVIAYIANETISIIENAGLMGLPIPKVITKAIDVLQGKSEGDQS